MSKLVLADIGSFSQAAVTTINSNNQAIENALENTLSRDGTTPNVMTADIDMNHNKILNVESLVIEGIDISDLSERLDDAVANAEADADRAEIAANAAEGVVTDALGVTIQPYDPDLTAWAAVNPSQYSTSAQIASFYQPLTPVLTNTTASFTTTLLTKLNGIQAGATANDTDANLKNRANHTGTQLAATISDFNTAADARVAAAVGVSVQAQDATLQALAGLNTTAGLVEQTGTDAFTKRAIGIGATTSILTRADGDGRYATIETSGTWTPTLVPDTPGTFSATWTQQQGRWFRNGNWIDVTFWLVGSFTAGTASGYVSIQGLSAAGFTCRSGLTNSMFLGGLRCNAITRAGYGEFLPSIGTGESNISIQCTGSGQAVDRLGISHINGAGSPVLVGHLRFPI